MSRAEPVSTPARNQPGDAPLDELSRLNAERACERLIMRYSHYIDFGQASRVADLFTEDGVWESPEIRMDGRSAIAAGFARRQQQAHRRSRHVCTNVVIELEGGDRATGLSYFVLFREDGVEGDGPAPLRGPHTVGEYRDTFVRGADGWKILRRTASAGFVRRDD